MTEHQIQAACVKWFNYQHATIKNLLFAIPNGAFLQGEKMQRIRLWKKLEAEGAKRGVPDLFLAVPSGEYAGLFIEMKAEKGRVSKEQRYMMLQLAKQGYRTEVAYSIEEFMMKVNIYLSLT
jgi:hypothetical protein